MVRYKEDEDNENVEEVFKPFSHREAAYRSPGGDDFNPNHERCKDCAHWDEHGNCHIVPDVEPDGYCEEFYADVGVFAHKHDAYIEENLTLIGDKFDFDMEDVKEFAGDIRERLQQVVR